MSKHTQEVRRRERVWACLIILRGWGLVVKNFSRFQEEDYLVGILLNTKTRSSPSEVFLGEDVLKISANLQKNTQAEVWFQ